MANHAEATCDGTLRPEDDMKVLENILKAQNHSQFIGLKLGVPKYVIDGILQTHSKPRDQLYDVIVEYLKQVEPGPTWRAIADVLKSPVIDLPHLAKKIENEHCSPAPAQSDQGLQTQQRDTAMETSPPPSQELATTLQPGLEVSQSPPFTDSREYTGSSFNLQPSSRSAVVARERLREVRENADPQQQLSRKEAELTRAEETIGREQQQTQKLREQGDVKQREKIQLQQQLRRQEAERDAKERELAQAQQQLRQLGESSRREIGDLQRQVQELRQQEQSCRREVGDLEQRLRSSEALVADFQKSLQQRDSELETLRTKTPSAALPSPQPSPQPQSGSTLNDPNSLLRLSSQMQETTAPRQMRRGSAVSDQNVAYFTPYCSNSLYRYTLREDKWEDLPKCTYHSSGLVIIDHKLTAVGGKVDRSRYTNEVLTLHEGEWGEEYSGMNTARSSPAVVSTSDGQHVIVIGGESTTNSIFKMLFRGVSTNTAVELLNTGTKRWTQITSLPKPFHFIPHLKCIIPSAIIWRNRLYVIGGYGNDYSCSLEALLASDAQTSPQQTWISVPHPPGDGSTIATYGNQLVIIGGKQDWIPYNFIYRLKDGYWVKCGSLSCDRYWCLVVSPSPDVVIVVGGSGSDFTELDSVEIVRRIKE